MPFYRALNDLGKVLVLGSILEPPVRLKGYILDETLPRSFYTL